MDVLELFGFGSPLLFTPRAGAGTGPSSIVASTAVPVGLFTAEDKHLDGKGHKGAEERWSNSPVNQAR